jgi:N-acetylmuramoyl-L-alanine amidase
MPSYLPNGWKISGDIQANPGSINYKLASADGDKSVSINEVRSDWDSQALAENYLSPNADKYTALQSEGLTIYIYNNNQASWVNHGTWYRIEGQDHGLSRDQIIKMATSL